MDENYWDKLFRQQKELLENIKEALPRLKELYEKHNNHWNYEDPIYRFYHQSYKVYHLPGQTEEIVTELKKLAPKGVIFNQFFQEIFNDGVAGKKFSSSHNKEWLKHTRPMVEAFMHAKFFLEMVIKYGDSLEEAPECLPSGWAALLYFYNLR